MVFTEKRKRHLREQYNAGASNMLQQWCRDVNDLLDYVDELERQHKVLLTGGRVAEMSHNVGGILDRIRSALGAQEPETTVTAAIRVKEERDKACLMVAEQAEEASKLREILGVRRDLKMAQGSLAILTATREVLQATHDETAAEAARRVVSDRNAWKAESNRWERDYRRIQELNDKIGPLLIELNVQPGTTSDEALTMALTRAKYLRAAIEDIGAIRREHEQKMTRCNEIVGAVMEIKKLWAKLPG